MMATGWLRDWPDNRDLTVDSAEVQPFRLPEQALPRKFRIPLVAPIKSQGRLGSCTAHGALGAYETFQAQVAGAVVPPLSRLFTYRTTRRVAGLRGDSGAYIRSTIKALALFGSCPEDSWPYTDDPAQFDREPEAYQYAMAQNYQALTYYRLDPPGKSGQKIVDSIKLNIFNRRPVVYGFTVFSNMDQSGDVAMPGRRDYARGGHCEYWTGWDDDYRIGSEVGAFEGRNSWDVAWGHGGRQMIPYRYILAGLASDIWTFMSVEWLDTGVFGGAA